ncbi:MAG: hypothetical protein FJ242_02900 [Nitrospira sp.]|nr:hypothetical protein [Nitrospira sp.]
MQTAEDIRKIEARKKLEKVFEKRQAVVLADIITSAYTELVKMSDFNELKQIVKELAEAQKRTEIKVAELSDYATKAFLKKAEERGVIVVQSFE